MDSDLNSYSYIQPLGRAPLKEKKITMMFYRGAYSGVYHWRLSRALLETSPPTTEKHTEEEA
jgi:hypothetical protein